MQLCKAMKFLHGVWIKRDSWITLGGMKYCDGAEWLRRRQKVLAMSHVLSSMQDICPLAACLRPCIKVIYHFACQAWGGVPKKALLLALKSKYLGLPKFWADSATATGFTEVKLSRYLTWQMVNYVFNAMCIAMTCRLLLCCIIFCSLRSAMFLATIHWRVIMVLFRDRRLNYLMWSTRRNILGQHVDLEAGSCVAAKIYV